MKATNRENLIVWGVLLLLGLSYRLSDYPPNFTPLSALSLFAGFYFRKSWAVCLPVLILFLSDIRIGFYDWRIMLAVYGSFVLIGLLGKFISRKKYGTRIVISSLAGSFLCFFITNLSVWLFGNWYAHDFRGLKDCSWMAIPFFRNTLAGDLFFSGMIFGAYELGAMLAENRLEKNESIIKEKYV